MTEDSNQKDNALQSVQTSGQSDQMLNHLRSAFSDDAIKAFWIDPIKESGRTDILERVNSTISDEAAKLKSFDEVEKLIDNAKSLSVWQGNMKKSATENKISFDDNGNILAINGDGATKPLEEVSQDVGAQREDGEIKSDYDSYLEDNKKQQFYATLDPKVAEKVKANADALGVDPLKYYMTHKEQLVSNVEEKEVAGDSNNSNEETTLQDEATEKKEAENKNDDAIDPNAAWYI